MTLARCEMRCTALSDGGQKWSGRFPVMKSARISSGILSPGRFRIPKLTKCHRKIPTWNCKRVVPTHSSALHQHSSHSQLFTLTMAEFSLNCWRVSNRIFPNCNKHFYGCFSLKNANHLSCTWIYSSQLESCEHSKNIIYNC